MFCSRLDALSVDRHDRSYGCSKPIICWRMGSHTTDGSMRTQEQAEMQTPLNIKCKASPQMGGKEDRPL